GLRGVSPGLALAPIWVVNDSRKCLRGVPRPQTVPPGAPGPLRGVVGGLGQPRSGGIGVRALLASGRGHSPDPCRGVESLLWGERRERLVPLFPLPLGGRQWPRRPSPAGPPTEASPGPPRPGQPGQRQHDGCPFRRPGRLGRPQRSAAAALPHPARPPHGARPLPNGTNRFADSPSPPFPASAPPRSLSGPLRFAWPPMAPNAAIHTSHDRVESRSDTDKRVIT